MAIPSPANKHSTVTNICWWEVERKCFCAATCRKLERDFFFRSSVFNFNTCNLSQRTHVPKCQCIQSSFLCSSENKPLFDRGRVKTLELWGKKEFVFVVLAKYLTKSYPRKKASIERKLWHATKKSVDQSKLTVDNCVYCQRLKGSWWIHVFHKMLSENICFPQNVIRQK